MDSTLVGQGARGWKENRDNENTKQKINLNIIISNLSCLYKSLILKKQSGRERDSEGRTSPMLQKKNDQSIFPSANQEKKKEV